MSMASCWKYTVFLSFRGKDTRKTFTDHLYTALVQARIRTFRDDNELSRGKEISAELLKAIQESQILIIVFSKNYASSRWCLDELVKIIECRRTMGKTVFPVFYDVEPSDVRRQTGSFAKAFANHEKRYADKRGMVQGWKAALSEAANLSGWDLQNAANGYESKFIQKIVEEVQCEVQRTHLNVVEFPVGIDSRVKDISLLLRIKSDDVRIIGIYGMGGVGKTTTVKAVYNSIFQYFECSYFLENVREVSKQPSGLVRLQKKFLSKILQRENFKIGNVDHGIELIKETLHAKKVLLVLDDLDELSQVKSLVGHRNWFGSGSRIILTTRNVQVLHQVQVDEVYKVEELNFDQSLELLSWHAFRKKIPLQGYTDFSEGIVRYTGGFPLALQALASSLVGKNVEVWKSTLEMLQKIHHKQIQEKLRLSFYALDDYTKEVFLDLACFFIGMHIDDAVSILNACGFFPKIAVSILMERCLLTINERNEFRMHDLLRDMGREIVRMESGEGPGEGPGGQSRLWFHEDAKDVLMNHKGTKAIEGIILEQPTSEPISLSTRTFERMPRLRLLQLDNAHLSGKFENIFQELRWLHMHHSHLNCLPTDLHLEKLVVLDMQYSSLTRVWDEIMELDNLKTVNLSHSEFLTTTPDFTKATNVETLLLEGCVSLMELHPSIELLNRMQYLDLNECRNLRELPDGICNLRSLERLNIRGCSSLEQLPENLGKMKCLKQLSADITAIRQMPDSIGFLKNLQELTLQGCDRIVPGKPWLSGSGMLSRIVPQSSNTICFPDCSKRADEDIPVDFGVGFHLSSCM